MRNRKYILEEHIPAFEQYKAKAERFANGHDDTAHDPEVSQGDLYFIELISQLSVGLETAPSNDEQMANKIEEIINNLSENTGENIYKELKKSNINRHLSTIISRYMPRIGTRLSWKIIAKYKDKIMALKDLVTNTIDNLDKDPSEYSDKSDKSNIYPAIMKIAVSIIESDELYDKFGLNYNYKILSKYDGQLSLIVLTLITILFFFVWKQQQDTPHIVHMNVNDMIYGIDDVYNQLVTNLSSFYGTQSTVLGNDHGIDQLNIKVAVNTTKDKTVIQPSFLTNTARELIPKDIRSADIAYGRSINKYLHMNAVTSFDSVIIRLIAIFSELLSINPTKIRKITATYVKKKDGSKRDIISISSNVREAMSNIYHILSNGLPHPIGSAAVAHRGFGHIGKILNNVAQYKGPYRYVKLDIKEFFESVRSITIGSKLAGYYGLNYRENETSGQYGYQALKLFTTLINTITASATKSNISEMINSNIRDIITVFPVHPFADLIRIFNNPGPDNKDLVKVISAKDIERDFIKYLITIQKTRLVTGHPLTHMNADLILHSFDRKMQQIANHVLGGVYIRYVDDILILYRNTVKPENVINIVRNGLHSISKIHSYLAKQTTLDKYIKIEDNGRRDEKIDNATLLVINKDKIQYGILDEESKVYFLGMRIYTKKDQLVIAQQHRRQVNHFIYHAKSVPIKPKKKYISEVLNYSNEYISILASYINRVELPDILNKIRIKITEMSDSLQEEKSKRGANHISKLITQLLQIMSKPAYNKYTYNKPVSILLNNYEPSKYGKVMVQDKVAAFLYSIWRIMRLWDKYITESHMSTIVEIDAIKIVIDIVAKHYNISSYKIKEVKDKHEVILSNIKP